MVIAANSGGAWTPIGDVTTTMLWIHGQISTVKTIQVHRWDPKETPATAYLPNLVPWDQGAGVEELAGLLHPASSHCALSLRKELLREPQLAQSLSQSVMMLTLCPVPQ